MISPLGLAKIKQQEFFLVPSFVRLLAYTWTVILWLRRSLCRRPDFIPLFFLLFCPYVYAYAHVWTRLNRMHQNVYDNYISCKWVLKEIDKSVAGQVARKNLFIHVSSLLQSIFCTQKKSNPLWEVLMCIMPRFGRNNESLMDIMKV